MSEPVELLPCPFCGSQTADVIVDSGQSRVICQECYARGPTCDIEDSFAAAEAWNSRADNAPFVYAWDRATTLCVFISYVGPERAILAGRAFLELVDLLKLHPSYLGP